MQVDEELSTPPLSLFLEKEPAGCELSEKFLTKWGRLLDIVTPEATRSCCFTKGYSVKAEGSGSVIQQTPESEITENAVSQTTESQTTANLEDNTRSLTNVELTGEAFHAHMKSLDLRYFTPR